MFCASYPLWGMCRCSWILKRAMKITDESDFHLRLSQCMWRTLRLACSLCLEDYKDSKVIWKIQVSSTHYENVGFFYRVASHLEIHPLSLSHKLCGMVENGALWSTCTHQNIGQLPQLHKEHWPCGIGGCGNCPTRCIDMPCCGYRSI